MIQGFLAADVRAAERPYLDAGVPLMERAAFALAVTALRELRRVRGTAAGATAIILAGKKNNGVDALFAGVHLRRRGVAVTAILVQGAGGGVEHRAAIAALQAAGGRVIPLVAALVSTHSEPQGQALCVATVAGADLVMDGVLGTGSRREPSIANTAGRPDWQKFLARIAATLSDRTAAEAPVVIAVDLPSGIDPDTGEVPDPRFVLPADVTVTFQAAKAGMLLPPAARFVGRIEVVDIGIGPVLDQRIPAVRCLTSSDDSVRRILAAPRWDDHKYTRGVVGVVAGSTHYPGAGVMATSAAVRAGAGMVRYLGPNRVADLIVAGSPEVVPAPGRVQAYVVGSGLPAWDYDQPADVAQQLTRAAAAIRIALRDTRLDHDPDQAPDKEQDQDGATPRGGDSDAAVLGLRSDQVARVPVVVDAGAFSVLPDRDADSPHRRPLAPWIVLTPHAGELVKLLTKYGEAKVTREQIEAHPARYARRAHDVTGATVALKGPVTVIAGEDGVWAQAGPSWLARAGSGDILAGLLGSLLSRWPLLDTDGTRPSIGEVVATGVLVHAAAGRIASGQRDDAGAPGHPPTADGILAAIPEAIGALLDATHRRDTYR